MGVLASFDLAMQPTSTRVLPIALLLSICNAVPLQLSMLATQQRVFKHLQMLGADGKLLTFPWCYYESEEYTNITMMELEHHLEQTNEFNYTDWDYFELLKSKNSSALNVYVDIGVFQIVEVSEKYRYLSLKLQTNMCWADCRIVWHYSMLPISQLILSPTLFNDLKLFVPYVSIFEELNPSNPAQSDYDAIVLSGYVCLRKTYSTTVSCNIDVSMYPLDTQQCSVTFIAMQERMAVALNPYEDLLNSSSLGLVAASIHTVGKRYTPSDTWELIILNGERQVRTTCIQNDQETCQSYDAITHRLVLRRHPTYQLLNLMLPAFLIVLISGCVFLIPPGSSDKMSLSITSLLSLFIFTQIMYNKMPETGETLPLLSQYFLASVALVSLSCVASSISMIFERSTGSITTKLPSLSVLFKGTSNHLLSGLLKIQGARRNLTAQNGPPKYETNVIELRRLARIFDRVFFVFHVMTSLTVLIVYMIRGYIPWKNYGYHCSTETHERPIF